MWLHTKLCLRALSKCYGCVSVCLSSRIHSWQCRKIELSREQLPHRCVCSIMKPATYVATHAAVIEEIWMFILVAWIVLYFFYQAKLYEIWGQTLPSGLAFASLVFRWRHNVWTQLSWQLVSGRGLLRMFLKYKVTFSKIHVKETRKKPFYMQ